ncbi:MAG: peptidase S41, partial [Prevotella sp.]|nr:peptidase S41 [Prevotella sp.]
TFNLRVKRPYVDEPIDFEIHRRKIVLDAVPYYGWLNDSVAYIFLSQFTDKAGQEVQDALVKMRADQQHSLKGLVFDLRQNGGGLLEEAVKIVGMFVPKGSPVVETKAKRPEWNSAYRTNTVPIEPQLPIVCLIDRNSASAAEILSGSLQDLDRAVIMGERSFGKGLVQSTRPLPYNTLMKFTTAKYYIPSGRCIQVINYKLGEAEQIPDSLTHVFYTANGREVRDGRGIKPDIEEKPQQMSGLAYYLEREYLTFDYATRYRQEHESIAPIGEFKLSDEEYDAFCKEALANRKDSILTLLKVFDMKHDLDSLREEIKEEVANEIILRYYHQRGQSEHSLLQDTLVKKAAQLVADQKRYSDILQPVNKKNKNNKK